MRYPKVLKLILSQCLYYYYQTTGIAKQKVVIKSVKSSVNCGGQRYPQREFYALNRSNKEMAWGKVMPGRFEEYRYHYCIFNGTVVRRWYRRRNLGAKLVKARLKFCQKEGFTYVVAPVEAKNHPSIKMLKRCGFEFPAKKDWFHWMQAEIEYLKGDDLRLGLYQIKKPAQC